MICCRCNIGIRLWMLPTCNPSAGSPWQYVIYDAVCGVLDSCRSTSLCVSYQFVARQEIEIMIVLLPLGTCLGSAVATLLCPNGSVVEGGMVLWLKVACCVLALSNG